MKQTWNSLTEVKNYIETQTSEIVENFNGWELTTNKNVYPLASSKLRVEERK